MVATDGVWDIMTNQEVVDFICKRMKHTVALDKIGLDLLKACKLPINPLTGLGSDNMTVIIAVLRYKSEKNAAATKGAHPATTAATTTAGKTAGAAGKQGGGTRAKH